MKKAFVLMLVLMLSLSFLLTVRAESMPSLYEALLSLMNGRQFILTVNAVGTDELEPMLAPYGAVTCMLYQKGGRIILTAACEREARLDAIADSEGVQISTNLTEAGEYACEWDSLQPAVTLTKDELSVRLTFPNYEWINFSFKVKGTHINFDFVSDADIRDFLVMNTEKRTAANHVVFFVYIKKFQ